MSPTPPLDAQALIASLDLAPHPEGGFYRETFRSEGSVQAPDGRVRPALTQIVFLLPSGVFSAWHKVESDEVWQHHEGGPLELHLLDDSGHRVLVLGAASQGQHPQAVVPAGVWQAARPASDQAVLCGCTVAPGFDFADFQMATADALAALFPQHRAIASELCRD
ncbi:MAG: cupin domain-containing protein [Myxococcota bacterium]